MPMPHQRDIPYVFACIHFHGFFFERSHESNTAEIAGSTQEGGLRALGLGLQHGPCGSDTLVRQQMVMGGRVPSPVRSSDSSTLSMLLWGRTFLSDNKWSWGDERPRPSRRKHARVEQF